MVILHVAAILDYLYNGVCVVVPQYVRAQRNYAEVGLLNLHGDRIRDVSNQFEWDPEKMLKALPNPFCRPDIVVFHEVWHLEYCKIAKYLEKEKIPYVIIPHGSLTTMALRKKWLKKKVAGILFFNRYVNHASAIQVLTENEFEYVRVRNKKIICPNGVEIPKCMKESFRKESFKILYVGRLEISIKGLDILLEAVQENLEFLKEKGCVIEVYGTGGEEFRDMVKARKLEELIRTLPAISGKEKEKAYLNADYFIQTSRSEGMPLGILEAMSYGLPCIITEGTGFGRTFRERDLGWVAETNAESVAAYLRQAIEEASLLKNKSKNCVETVRKLFSWEQVTEKTLNEYQKLL